jgi:hypothetical protein
VMPPGSAAKDVASVLDVVDEPRDLVGSPYLKAFRSVETGEGSGDMSSKAFNCGEDITDPGDNDPADECKAARMLGARRGRLDAEVLCRRRPSDSKDRGEKGGWRGVKSVII